MPYITAYFIGNFGDAAGAPACTATAAGAAALPASPLRDGRAGRCIPEFILPASTPIRSITLSDLSCTRSEYSITPCSTPTARASMRKFPFGSAMNPPKIMCCAPSSLPMRTAVSRSTCPPVTSFCSSMSFCTWSRSIRRMFGLAAISVMRKSAIPLLNLS